MTFYVAGTLEKVDDPNEYLEKEEKYCRANPDFIRDWWLGKDKLNEVTSFNFDSALASYLEGLRNDVATNPQYTVKSP